MAQFDHYSRYATMSSRNLFVKNALTKGHLKTHMMQHLNEMPDVGTKLNCVYPGMRQGIQYLGGMEDKLEVCNISIHYIITICNLGQIKTNS